MIIATAWMTMIVEEGGFAMGNLVCRHVIFWCLKEVRLAIKCIIGTVSRTRDVHVERLNNGVRPSEGFLFLFGPR